MKIKCPFCQMLSDFGRHAVKEKRLSLIFYKMIKRITKIGDKFTLISKKSTLKLRIYTDIMRT